MAGNELLVGALFILIGVILGVMGSGGSIVTLPVLTYLAGFEAEQAVTATLVVVGTASLIGALLYFRRGYSHWKATVFLGVAGMPGAYLGASLTGLAPPRLLMLIFAAVMMGAGVTMLSRGESPRPHGRSLVRLGLIGLTIGVLAGFLGVGGGFLIVPALVVFGGIGTRRAISASLGVIALNSVAGIAGHLGSVTLPWTVVMAFVPLAVAGIWMGTQVAGRLSEFRLRQAFAWTIIAIAVVIGGSNLVGG